MFVLYMTTMCSHEKKVGRELEIMTATEVLRTICDRQGVDVLSDGKQLLGLFEDYSRGKLRPQAHALRVLVECGGNKRM